MPADAEGEAVLGLDFAHHKVLAFEAFDVVDAVAQITRAEPQAAARSLRGSSPAIRSRPPPRAPPRRRRSEKKNFRQHCVGT